MIILLLKALTPATVTIRGHLRGSSYVAPYRALRRKAPPGQGGFGFDDPTDVAPPAPKPKPKPESTPAPKPRQMGQTSLLFDDFPAPEPKPEPKPDPEPPKKREPVIGLPKTPRRGSKPHEKTLDWFFNDHLLTHSASRFHHRAIDSLTEQDTREIVAEYFHELRRAVLRGETIRDEQWQSIGMDGPPDSLWRPNEIRELPVEALVERGKAVVDRICPEFHNKMIAGTQKEQVAAKARNTQNKKRLEQFKADTFNNPEWNQRWETRGKPLIEALRTLVENNQDKLKRDIDPADYEYALFRNLPDQIAGTDIGYMAAAYEVQVNKIAPDAMTLGEPGVVTDDPALSQQLDQIGRGIAALLRARSAAVEQAVDQAEKAFPTEKADLKTQGAARKHAGETLLAAIRDHHIRQRGKETFEREQREWITTTVNGIRDHVSDDPDLIKKLKADIRKSLKRFFALYGKPTAVNLLIADQERSCYVQRSRAVVISAQEKSMDDVLFHEIGHHLEDTSGGEMWEMSRKFILSRCPPDSMAQLKDITKAGYGNDEIAYRDKGVDPYVWKVYEGSKSSEVFSMAIERMSNPTKLMRFFEADPDHFYLMMAAIPTLRERGVDTALTEAEIKNPDLKASLINWDRQVKDLKTFKEKARIL